MNRRALRWTEGNRIELLENGEAFFPRALAQIRAARREIRLETFILAFDEVGVALQKELIAAASRGVAVHLTIDGYGAGDLPAHFVHEMCAAGVQVGFYDPAPTLFGVRRNLFRRLHRKLLLVDDRVAFVGGINFVADHLRSFGSTSKQDYAAQVEGPIVVEIRQLLQGVGAEQMSDPKSTLRKASIEAASLGSKGRIDRRFRASPRVEMPPMPCAALVTRDNHRHRRDIEREYRLALKGARRDMIIANAYFLPSWRLLHAIARAARRGIRVRLLLQGEPDIPLVRWAASALYDYLLRAGVEIYEYRERPFHGKVAVMDEIWSTIGSSNLDPLSLALNLEANLIIMDEAFNADLRQSLERLLAGNTSRKIRRRRASWWRKGLTMLIFQVLKRYPAVVGMFPGHATPEPRKVSLS